MHHLQRTSLWLMVMILLLTVSAAIAGKGGYIIEETPYNATLSPVSGKTTALFTWNVSYYDSNSAAPLATNILIDGASHPMNLSSGNTFDGVYIYTQYFSSTGVHNYAFQFTDSIGTTFSYPTIGTFSGPTVLLSASLSNPLVTPTYGATSASYTWNVSYYDPNGFAPALKQINIDGSPYTMTLNSGSVSSGVYSYTTTLNQPGLHIYSFNFQDSMGEALNLPAAGTYSGPTVNTTPTLSGGYVTPGYSESTSVFTFVVNCKDSDFHYPSTMNLYLNGTPLNMGLFSGLPDNATYTYQTILPAGIYSFYYQCTDPYGATARFPAAGTLSGPTVNNLPVLSNAVINPTYGIPSSSFTWSVNYVDADGNTPSSAQVNIDGSLYTVSLNSGSASNGTYAVTRALNTAGIHTYYFVFSDGLGSSVRYPAAGTFSGPTVNTTPTLTGGIVNPVYGPSTSQFTFSVICQDSDSQYPSTLQIVLDGNTYNMSLFSGLPASATYVFTTTLNSGVHNYYYQGTDPYGASARFPSSGTLSGPTVNSSPVLSSESVSPTYGIPSSSFTWSVNYVDADGNAPTTAQVNIDGTTYTMNLSSGVAANGTYVITSSLRTAGVHTYYFVFSDGIGSSVRYPTASTFSGPTVNTTPTLTSGSVSPAYAPNTTPFIFTVICQDPDSQYPSTLQIVLDGNTYNMSLFSGLPASATYTFTTTLSSGVHNYYFQGTDPYGASARFPSSGTLSGPTVNTPPSLFTGIVTPIVAPNTTSFTYTINFQDPDLHAPTVKQLFIDGTPVTMTLQGGTYANATFAYSTTLVSGIHNYYFQFTDPFGTTARYPANGTLSGPTVNSAPVLSAELVSPTYALPSSSFTWNVNYVDADGNAPTVSQIYIDGTAYSMSLFSGTAANGTYRFSQNINTAGVHNYYFNFSDGIASAVRYPASGTFSGPTVNTSPTLTNGYVSPGYASPSSTFTFVVDLHDVDLHYAATRQIVIDGTPLNMSLFSGTADNATYVFYTTLAVGIHNFYYQFTDPYGASARFPAAGTLSGPTVNTPVTLSGGYVSPSVGNNTTVFTYVVNSQDPDFHYPAVKQVYIDGTPFTMTLFNGLPNNATYTYATTLSAGIHNYYFSFTDPYGTSARYPTSGTLSGPTVGLEAGLTQGIVTPIAGLSTTGYRWSVYYYDPLNATPLSNKVVIDGTIYNLTLSSGSASNGTYAFTTSSLAVGIHNYYFDFTDSVSRNLLLPTAGTYSGPSVYQLSTPTNLLATETLQTTIFLTWKDNSSDEEGFGIEYRSESGNWQFLSIAAANATTFTHAPAPYDYYFYRVYAYKNGVHSEYSNITSTSLGLWTNPMGDFDVASDSTNFAHELPADAYSKPTFSWLSTYSGRTGVLKLTFSTATQGLKITGLGRLKAYNPSTPWHRLRITFNIDTPVKGLEVLPMILFYDSFTSYTIRELGGSWSSKGLLNQNTWYTIEAYAYSHSTSGYLQCFFKNSGIPGNIYVDKVEWDYTTPPAIQHPGNIAFARGDFDVPADTTGWAFQNMESCALVRPTTGWSATVGSQAGVLALNYSALTQGVKVTSVDTFITPTGRNVVMSYKIYIPNSSPTTVHISGLILGEKDFANGLFDLGGYSSIGNIPGNTWMTFNAPLSSVSQQTSYRLQLQFKNNFYFPVIIYLDDVQFYYDNVGLTPPKELVEVIEPEPAVLRHA